MGSQNKAHGSGAGGQNLLPFGNFHVRSGTAYHRNDKRRPQQSLRFSSYVLRLGLGMLRAESGGDALACAAAGVTLEDDETPRLQFSVVRDA